MAAFYPSPDLSLSYFLLCRSFHLAILEIKSFFLCFNVTFVVELVPWGVILIWGAVST